jgi:hypothetical protein
MEEKKKKKPYSKPQIEFYDFSISNNIASNCEVTTPLHTQLGVCGYLDSQGQAVFNNTFASACKKSVGYTGGYNDPGDNPDMGTICYTTVGGGNNLFSS